MPGDELNKLVLEYKKNPNPQLFELIWKQVKKDVDYAISRYAASGIDTDVMEMRARKLLNDAINSFNERKSSFRTHYSNYLMKLYRFVNQYQHPVRLPENYKLNYNIYERVYGEFVATHGREPSLAELERLTGLPRHQLEAFRARGFEASTPEDWAVYTMSDLEKKEVIEDIRRLYGDTYARAYEEYLRTGKIPSYVDRSSFKKILERYKEG